jgi:hypothetical protein
VCVRVCALARWFLFTSLWQEVGSERVRACVRARAFVWSSAGCFVCCVRVLFASGRTHWRAPVCVCVCCECVCCECVL